MMAHLEIYADLQEFVKTEILTICVRDQSLLDYGIGCIKRKGGIGVYDENKMSLSSGGAMTSNRCDTQNLRDLLWL